MPPHPTPTDRPAAPAGVSITLPFRPPSGRPREGHAMGPPAVTLPPFDEARDRRFEAFAAGFEDVFARADQFRRFRVYLRGLLDPGERKNVEGIAARATAPAESDVAQALQHFVSQSPWDTGRLLASYRRQLAGRLADPAAVWVVHDGVIPKRGLHSVGAQRQFARAVGRKLNCQIAVTVAQVGPAGFYPLAVRLYLPGYWLREHPAAVAKTVPEEFRRPASKAEIALGLLDELRAEGRTCPGLVTEDGYETAEFRDGLAGRGLGDAIRPDDGVVSLARRRFDWLKEALGLDHFEGRTWHGWHHHVGLVFAAYGFLAAEGSAGDQPPFPTHSRSSI